MAGCRDEEAERLRDVTLLYGWLPQEWRASAGGPVRSHRHLDRRARRLASEIADRLPNDASILDRALQWIDQRLEETDARGARDLREWRRILSELSIQQVQALLREESERADRLRQSLPFVEVLTRGERKQLFA